MPEVALTLGKTVRGVWPSEAQCCRAGWLQGQCPAALELSPVESSSGLAAPGTLESTGDVLFEAVIPSGLPRRVQHVQLAKVPDEEWSCCSDSWCHSLSSWCPPGWGYHRHGQCWKMRPLPSSNSP